MLHQFRPQLEEALKKETDAKATYILKELLAQNEQEKGIEDIDTGKDYMHLAKYYIEQGRSADALPFCHQTLLTWLQGVQAIHPDTAQLHSTIATIYNELGNYPLAIEYFNKAILIYDLLYEENNWLSLDNYNYLASSYINMEDFSAALKIYDNIIPHLIKFHGETSATVGGTYYGLANAYYGDKNYPVALQYFKQALEIVSSLLSEGNEEIKHFVQTYAAALSRCRKEIPDDLFQEHLAFIKAGYISYFQ